MEKDLRLETDDWLTKNCGNSSKSPSSDGYNKLAPKSLGKRHGRKSGGKPGHTGYTLKAMMSPYYNEVHQIKQCSHCEAELKEVDTSIHEKRRVFDVPRVRTEVTEHQIEIKHSHFVVKCPKLLFHQV